MELVGLPLEKSPWRKLYTLAAEACLSSDADVQISDLGCGAGRFARLLFERGHRRYVGVDFSSVRIEEARRYVPKFCFVCADLLGSRVPDSVWQGGCVHGSRAFGACDR